MPHHVLRITAGTDYDPATHIEVPVNSPEPVVLRGLGADIALNVRIQNYTHGQSIGSPETSPYFTGEHAADTYSIAFWFMPRRTDRGTATTDNLGNSPDNRPESPTSSQGISAHDLQWGNDFDQPIRDRLPPGFGTALRIVKWWIDPGIDGDPYADRPFLYGPALSSFNRVYVGVAEKPFDKGSHISHDARGLCFTEGGDEAGRALRLAAGCPGGDETEQLDKEDLAAAAATSVAAARQKWALRDDAKTQWLWRYGVAYGFDFFNGYLDFAELALRLPGFHLPIMKYWDGQALRYVLRNRTTNEVYLVVQFNLFHEDDVTEHGGIKGEELERQSDNMQAKEGGVQNGSNHLDVEEALDMVGQKLSATGEVEVSSDDVD